MDHKVPMRTYSRKGCKELAISLEKLHIPRINNVWNKSRISLKEDSSAPGIKKANNDSMYYDPFDTTFDRLVKNARARMQALKTCKKIVYNNVDSSFYDSSISKTADDIKIPETSVKFVSKKKMVRRKLKMQVAKKTIAKKEAVKPKVKKNTSLKKYEFRKTRNKKKIASANPNRDSSCVSKIENYHSVHNEVQTNGTNEKYVSRNDKDSNSEQFLNSYRGFKLKSCSVVLDGSDVLGWKMKNNIKIDSLGEIERSISEIYETSKDTGIIKRGISGVKDDTVNMKHCFVKIEQLGVTLTKKAFSIGKNVVSSTPIGRPICSMAHLISVSPIPIGKSSKLNKLVQSIDSKSINTSISTDFNHSDAKQVNVDQEEQSLEILSEKLVDSKKDIVITETEKVDTLNVSSASTQKQAILDTVEKKPCLNFSIDTDRSRSLFGETNENICPLLHSVNAADTEKPSIIYISDVIDKDLSNESCANSIKLGKESISNIGDSKIQIMYNKTKEDLCEVLSPVKGNSDVSYSDVKLTLRTGNVDCTYSNTVNVNLEMQTVVTNNNILGTNSFTYNDKICDTSKTDIVLSQLQNPVRVTRKRKQYCTWELNLTNTSENGIESHKNQIPPKKTSKSRKMKLQTNMLQQLETITEMPINNKSKKVEIPIYLKPGKLWVRSLSILSSIQCKPNLETLSMGKGKKWRYSVQDILNMQKQGVIQTCIRKNGNDEVLQGNNEIINQSEQEFANSKSRTCDSTSFGRLSRRISVRVVPINKTVKSIEDVSFLEAYGIIPVKGKKVSLIHNTEKSSLCNIQNDNADGHIIKEHIVSTAKQVILERCGQKDYISFSTHFSDLYIEHCRKIGEGVYGEVFLYEHEDKKSVIKIIPIEGNELVNGEPQKKFQEILSEIVIAMELHNLRFNVKYNTDGFVEVKNVKYIKGKYPEKLVELWNIYDEEKRSDNDCPSIFTDDQLYIALELGHGGQDLEAFVFHTAEEAYFLFIQAALALAVAEKAIEFEHRDLHWGNILISRTNESHVYYQLGQQKVALISKGVKVSIIDFTLSRVTYQGCSVFNDLASDPALFTAQGEYQFEIYRLMRDKIKNNWKRFEPYTNILWLHYTLDKMITAVRYKRKNLKIHKHGLVKLGELKNEILTYSSAFDFVTKCDKIVSLLCTDVESELA